MVYKKYFCNLNTQKYVHRSIQKLKYFSPVGDAQKSLKTISEPKRCCKCQNCANAKILNPKKNISQSTPAPEKKF